MMKIRIHDNRRISEIQQEFTGLFPNLRIEFFARPSKTDAPASHKLIMHSNNKKLLECRSTHESGTIEILPFMNKRQLQDHFSDVFGLTIEIFRKSEKGVIPSLVGNKLPLKEENLLK